MSLLDDVSIVVTPNGYKAGELYAVIPVPTYGAELVTDGDFPTGTTAWTAPSGWTLGGGVAAWDAAGTYTWISQEVGVVVGKRFKVTFDCVINSGNLYVLLANGGDTPSITQSGSYEFILTPTGGGSSDTKIRVYQTIANSDFTITNISVKEYTSADMDVTRATAATRVDENGLVNYAQVVSETELVTNGGFATDSDWIKRNGSTISGGVGNIIANGSTSSDYLNWSLQQENIFIPSTSYRIQFKARQTGGTGNFNVGYSWAFILNQAITSSFVDYSIDFTTSSSVGYNNLSFGGLTIGDTFEIDNVSVKQVDRDNVPRIDYTGGGCPHILAEPMRTNTVTYSEDFSQYSAGGTPPTLTTGQLAPDGTYNATKVSGVIGSTSLNRT